MAKKASSWNKQQAAIRATQLAFDLSSKIQKTIKKAAIDNDLTPSDMIRQILDLDVKSKKTRQRLSFYLNDEEIAELAARYSLAPDDKLGVKQQVAQALIEFAQGEEES